jgi:hypothetical protein
VTFIALIKFADVAIGLRLCVRTDEPTVSGKIDHPAPSFSPRERRWLYEPAPGAREARPRLMQTG